MYVMATDGGPHPPDKWAKVSAQQIIDDIEANAPEIRVREARTFQSDLEGVLADHHNGVQEHERTAIIEHGDARLLHPLDPEPHIWAAVAAIVGAASGHTFEGYFGRPETQEYLHRLLSSHFATSMHIERSWHADRNPDSEQARTFRATYHPGV